MDFELNAGVFRFCLGGSQEISRRAPTFVLERAKCGATKAGTPRKFSSSGDTLVAVKGTREDRTVRQAVLMFMRFM